MLSWVGSGDQTGSELFEDLGFLWYFISFHFLKSLEVVNNIPLYSEESETQKGSGCCPSLGGKLALATPHTACRPRATGHILS